MIIIRKAVRGVSRRSLVRFVHRARVAAGLPGRVDIVLVSSSTTRKLNRSFRGKDKATDVLAFPSVPLMLSKSRAQGTHAWPLAGEIVISSEIAAANAQRYGHKPVQEVKVLIVHGMLHLAGYDHEHDKGTMARKEERLRRELGLSDGLIRRTAKRPRASWRQKLRKVKAAVRRRVGRRRKR